MGKEERGFSEQGTPEEKLPEVKRSPEEIKARLEELEKEYWFLSGIHSNMEKQWVPKRDLPWKAMRELEWVLGRDIDVREGLY